MLGPFRVCKCDPRNILPAIAGRIENGGKNLITLASCSVAIYRALHYNGPLRKNPARDCRITPLNCRLIEACEGCCARKMYARDDSRNYFFHFDRDRAKAAINVRYFAPSVRWTRTESMPDRWNALGCVIAQRCDFSRNHVDSKRLVSLTRSSKYHFALLTLNRSIAEHGLVFRSRRD